MTETQYLVLEGKVEMAVNDNDGYGYLRFTAPRYDGVEELLIEHLFPDGMAGEAKRVRITMEVLADEEEAGANGNT